MHPPKSAPRRAITTPTAETSGRKLGVNGLMALWDRVAWTFLMLIIAVGLFFAAWSFAAASFALPDAAMSSGVSSVLITQHSPHNQGSVWVESPEGTAIAADPDVAVTVSFYSSFETGAAVATREELEDHLHSAEPDLGEYSVRYVLVGRLAQASSDLACAGGLVGPERSFTELSADEQRMAAAIGRGSARADGRESERKGELSAVDQKYRVLLPAMTTATHYYPRVVDGRSLYQPTATSLITCTFPQSAFWQENETDGSATFVAPSVHATLRDSRDTSSAAPHGGSLYMQANFVMEAALRQRFEATKRYLQPKRVELGELYQRPSPENQIPAGASTLRVGEEAILFSDTHHSGRVNSQLFVAGILSAIAATALWEALTPWARAGINSLISWVVERRH